MGQGPTLHTERMEGAGPSDNLLRVFQAVMLGAASRTLRLVAGGVPGRHTLRFIPGRVRLAAPCVPSGFFFARAVVMMTPD